MRFKIEKRINSVKECGAFIRLLPPSPCPCKGLKKYCSKEYNFSEE